jgi:hypothetical protein
LADIIRGLKSDGSFTEIETSEALLTHYDIDFSFTQNPLGETIISVLPWVDQDQDRNQ